MKQNVKIMLDLQEMLYLIKDATYLRGRALKSSTEASDEATSLLMVNDDDENKSDILRSVNLAFGNLQKEIAEYLDEYGTNASNKPLDDDEVDTLTLSLQMPMNFNMVAKNDIARQAQEYIVNTAIANWYIKTKTDEAKVYADLAVLAMAELKKAMNKRLRPTR